MKPIVAVVALVLISIVVAPIGGRFDPYDVPDADPAEVNPCLSARPISIGISPAERVAEKMEYGDSQADVAYPPVDVRLCRISPVNECIAIGSGAVVRDLVVMVVALRDEAQAKGRFQLLRTERLVGDLAYPHFKDRQVGSHAAYTAQLGPGGPLVSAQLHQRAVVAVGATACGDPSLDLDGLWDNVSSQLTLNVSVQEQRAPG